MSPRPPKPKPSKPRAKPSAPAWRRGVAEAVVHGALLRIGEHLVRLVDLLELGLGAGFLVAVRVELHRQLAEGLLQLVGAGAAGHAEHIVVVLLLLSSHLACIAP